MSVCTTTQLVREAMAGATREPIDVTIVLPAYNEADTIKSSYDEIVSVMDPTELYYELIFVDDGSTDGTWQAVVALAERDRRVRGIRHRRNAGKASALANGFAFARGSIVATCDADMQYDPNDIVRIIEKTCEDFDAVSARKVIRRDPLSKRLPSKFFNFFVRKTTGVQLHDMNAGLKAYRLEAARELVRYGYGELHRFFVVILALKGFSIGEVPVESRPRTKGKSKYGLERYLRGAMDFLTVFFLSGYLERPLHLFGGLAVMFLGFSGLIAAYVLVAWLTAGIGSGAGSLLDLSATLGVSGVLLLVLGLVAEMINNLEHGSMPKGKVSEVIGIDRRMEEPSAQMVAVERRSPGAGVTLLDGDQMIPRRPMTGAPVREAGE
jgi:glycosyltransferase involved in cell wall biosynthesis